MDAIFTEIATAADRVDLISSLYTKDLPLEIRIDQLERLRDTKKFGGGPEPLVGGGFLLRQRFRGRVHLAIHTENLSSTEKDDLTSSLLGYGAALLPFDVSAFCSLAINSSGYFRIKTEYRSRESAIDLVDLFDKDGSYDGHDIFDVMNWYEDVSIYELSADSILNTCSSIYISALLSCIHSRYRSSLIGEDLVEDILNLLQLPNVNPENIYMSLTTVHWRHVYLEIYRLVEALYYLPWIVSFRMISGHVSPGLQLAQQCRDGLAWREKELSSIRKLFEMLPSEKVLRADLLATSIFDAVKPDERTAGGVAERLYKVRNQLVHQEDYEERVPIEMKLNDWPIAVSALVSFASELYRVHASDAAYDFSLDPKEVAKLVRAVA